MSDKKMLSDEDIIAIIKQEEHDALSYSGDDSDLNSLRATVLDYYDQKPYGNEEEGKSHLVTSEVFQVVEGLTPEIVAPVVQGRHVAEFKPTRKETNLEKLKRMQELRSKAVESQDASLLQGFDPKEDFFEKEAEEKQAIINHILTQENQIQTVLYDMTKDGLQAAEGWVQVYFDEEITTEVDRITGISETEVELAESNDGSTVTEQTQDEDGTFSITVETNKTERKYLVEPIPYEECVLSARARSYKNPPLIGQRMEKTRGQIRAMGIASDDVIDDLTQDFTETSRVKNSRHSETGEKVEGLSTSLDPSMDKLWLRRYYMMIDVDQDGIAEMWEIFYCDNVVLKKSRVYDHPYVVFVPIPKPHSARGTTPVFHMMQYQRWVSALTRQWLDNIWNINTPRYLGTKKVNREQWNNPRAGQLVDVNAPTVGDQAMMIPVDNQGQQIMMAIDYAYSMIEKTTGFTAQNQGLNQDSVNKTATGILTLKESGAKRSELMSQHLGVCVKQICDKLVKLVAYHQDTDMQILVNGEELTINPKKWSGNTRCIVEIGTGSGARQEAVQSLSYLLEQAKYFDQTGSTVTDDSKIYNLMNKLCVEMGYQSAEDFFNDPSIPEDQLMAQNKQLKQAVQQMQQQIKSEALFLEAEKIKAQERSQKTKADMQDRGKKRMADMAMQKAEFEHDRRMKQADLIFDREKLDTDTAVKLTDIQASTSKKVDGDYIDG